MSDSDYLLDDDGPEWTVADTARQLALDLQEVEAERDRLQAAVDELTETGTRDLHVLHRISTAVGARENLPDAVLAALNERDRLRAVVEALTDFLVLRGNADFPATDKQQGDMMRAWRRMLELRDQLDVGANIGGGDG